MEGRLKCLEFINATSQIVELDFELAVSAGETDLKMKKRAKGWVLTDSIILCTARGQKAKVVTSDEHFRDLEEVIFIK